VYLRAIGGKEGRIWGAQGDSEKLKQEWEKVNAGAGKVLLSKVKLAFRTGGRLANDGKES